MVYNVVPTYEPLHVHKNGTANEILKYTLYMNEQIEKKCREYSFTYFNIYDKYSDDRNFLIPEYSDKVCHINDPVFAEEFLKEYIQNL